MGKPQPAIMKYDYLSGDLLRIAYQEATGRPLSSAAALDLPGVAREAEQYLLGLAVPLVAAQPGDYLHVPDMSLDFIDWSAGPGSWTGALLTNSQDTGTPESAGILLVLAGPIEDCREWVSHGGAPRMPLPDTPTAMRQAIEALSGKTLEATIGDLHHQPARGGRRTAGEPVPLLAHGLTVAFRRETLARVLIRETIPAPYTSIVIGVPLWVRQLAPSTAAMSQR